MGKLLKRPLVGSGLIAGVVLSNSASATVSFAGSVQSVLNDASTDVGTAGGYVVLAVGALVALGLILKVMNKI